MTNSGFFHEFYTQFEAPSCPRFTAPQQSSQNKTVLRKMKEP